MFRVILCGLASVCLFEIIHSIGLASTGKLRMGFGPSYSPSGSIANPGADDIWWWRIFKDGIFLFWGAVLGWLWQMRLDFKDLAEEVDEELAHRKKS
jgi:hypothetical protein